MPGEFNDHIVTEEAPDIQREAPALANESSDPTGENTENAPVDDNTANDLPDTEDGMPATEGFATPAPDAREEPEIVDPGARELPETPETPPVYLHRDVPTGENSDEDAAREDAYRQLQDYMADRNYSKEDFDTYSQDPQWQDLHQQAFPEHYTDAQQADSAQADVPQNAQGYEFSREVPTTDTEQSNDAAVLTEENPEFAQQHENSRQRLCADAGRRPGRA